MAEPKKAKAAPKKKQYWQKKVFIMGLGACTGEVTAEQLKAFKAVVNPDTDISEYIGDKDVFGDLEKERKKKAAEAKAADDE